MLRWWLSFLVVFAVLLASLTTLISLVLKQVEPFISRLPSNITLMMELKTWFPLLPKRLLLRYTIYWYLLPSVTSYQMHAWWLYGQANASCHLQRNFWHSECSHGNYEILRILTYTVETLWCLSTGSTFLPWERAVIILPTLSKYLKFNIQTFFCFIKFDHCSLINGGGCEPVCGNVIPSCIQYGARLWHVFTLRETWWCMESI